MQRNPRSDPGPLKEPKINAKPFRTVVLGMSVSKNDVGDIVRRLVERDGGVLVVAPKAYRSFLRK